jgi:peroxiredoxin
MNKKEFLTGFFILFLFTCAAWLWFIPKSLNTAPAVTFKIIDGRQIDLINLQGRPVLVTFWATTCSSCMKEMPHLISLYNDLSGQGLEIIGVAMSYDPPNLVAALTRRRQIPFMISLDIDGSIAKAFDKVKLTPTTFLIAQDGTIISQKTGELNIDELRQQIFGLLSQQSQVTSNKLQGTDNEAGA